MASTAGSMVKFAVAGFVGLGIAAAATAQPAAAGDSLGRRLVRKYCATCHEVAPHPTGARRGADGAPGFAALATDPVKGDPGHLKALLGGPHSEMPPHRFSDAEVQAIVAYIRGLGAKSGRHGAGGTR
ncbi:MAG: c-type cytochrome [Nevskia sp.]|nr:c-type cytochrome [Nevskia sp.]